MKSKIIIRHFILCLTMLLCGLLLSMLDVYQFSEKVRSMPLDVCMFDYLTRGASSIIAGINFYIFGIISMFCTAFLIEEDYIYNVILKRGKKKMFKSQVSRVFLLSVSFSLIFFAFLFIVSLSKSDVFYNWNQMNGYFFYSYKYLIHFNPYLLLFLLWLQIFSFAFRVLLLYVNLKWIFFKKNEAGIFVIGMIIIAAEKLINRTWFYVNAATVYTGTVYNMLIINFIVIIFSLIVLNGIIKKRDI